MSFLSRRGVDDRLRLFRSPTIIAWSFSTTIVSLAVSHFSPHGSQRCSPPSIPSLAGQRDWGLPQADHHVSRIASAYRGCVGGRPNTFQYASQCKGLYQCGTQYRPLRMTRSRALHAATSAGLLSAAITRSTSASMTGSDIPPTFCDPFVAAAREVKNVLNASPGVLENPNH